jgi:hypothetical protein
MIGGIGGKSIFDNVKPHVNKKMVVTLDLKDCFPRVNFETILSIFINGLKCSEEIGRILTKLTTYQTRLPQGAPTSTMLANISLLPLHDDVEKISRARDLNWTFFVDDITLSGDDSLKAIGPVIHAIQKHGHAVSNQKMKLMPSSSRQEVTGLVLNRKTNISSVKIESIRREIWELSNKPDPINQNELDSIYGKIAFVEKVCYIRGASLKKMAGSYLPSSGKKLSKQIIDEIRPCKNSKIHSKHRFD